MRRIFDDIGYVSISGGYRELTEYLNGSLELLSKNGNILDNALEMLDVQQHSLGILYILVAKLSNLSVSQHRFIWQMSIGIAECIVTVILLFSGFIC